MRTITSVLKPGLLAGMLFGSVLTAEAAESLNHGPVALGVVHLGVILFIGLVGSLVANRLQISPLAGQFVGGIILGCIFPGPPMTDVGELGIFQQAPYLEGFFWVGMTLLMLDVGLGMSPSRFVSCSAVGSCLGGLGFLVSLAIVTVLASQRFPGVPVAGHLPLIVAAILSFSSHNQGLDAMRRAGKADSPEAETVRSSTMLVTLLGVLLWIGIGIIDSTDAAVSGGLASGLHFIGRLLASCCLVVAMFMLASHHAPRLLKYFKTLENIAVLLMSLLIFALVFLLDFREFLPMAAYLIALSVAPTELAPAVRNEIRKLLRFLMPVVVIVVGMSVDIRVLGQDGAIISVLGVALALLVAALVGFGLPARLTHFNNRGMVRVALAMFPRGVVTLVAAMAALQSGLIPYDLFNILMLGTCCTWIVGVIGVNIAARNPRPGLRKPLNMDEGTEHVQLSMPTPELAAMVFVKAGETFVNEGFVAAHAPDWVEQGRAEYRKGSTRAVCRRVATEVDLECRHVDRPLCALILYDALARVLEALKDMDRSMELRELRRLVQNGRQPGLPHVLPPVDVSSDLIVPALDGGSLEDTVGQLLEHLGAMGRVQDVTLARRDLLKRERILSSGLQHGLALCRARTTTVKAPEWVIGVCKDGRKISPGETHVVLIWLSPPHAVPGEIELLSNLLRHLSAEVLVALPKASSNVGMAGLIQHGPEPLAPTIPATREAGHVWHAAEPSELADFLAANMVEVSLQGSNKAEIIAELLEIIRRSGRLKDVDAVREAVLDRENQMSTGMEHGVAVPHARTDAVESFVAVVGTRPEGVDFGSVDSEASTIFVMSLARPDETATYVRFMAAVSRTLDAAGRARVLAAKTNAELWRALTTRPGDDD